MEDDHARLSIGHFLEHTSVFISAGQLQDTAAGRSSIKIGLFSHRNRSSRQLVVKQIVK